MEQWKTVEGWEHYEVSNTGKLRNAKGRILKERKSKAGYIHYLLQKEGIKSEQYVHRLVAKAFLPNPNTLAQVNHIDNNKGNNHASNLEWITPKQNIRHATKRFHRNCGENNWNAKMSLEKAQLIHRLLACGVKRKDIATAANVPIYQVDHLKVGGWAVAKES